MAELVRDIMERDPATIQVDDSIQDVIRVLRKHELPGVPVVDEEGRCVGIVTEAERALARVDVGAIERNCSRLRSLLGDAELCAVVKADGYGHGAVWAARAALAGGATWLGVATAAEAEDLRRHGLPGPILVMGALTAEDARTALEADADVVAWKEEFVRALAERAPPGARPSRVHVKLDTGMGRLGTSDTD